MTSTASQTSAAAGALAAPVATDVRFNILRFDPEVVSNPALVKCFDDLGLAVFEDRLCGGS